MIKAGYQPHFTQNGLKSCQTIHESSSQQLASFVRRQETYELANHIILRKATIPLVTSLR